MSSLNTQHAVRFMRSSLNNFRPGPFSKSATPEVKSFAGLLARSSHRTAVAAKWIFRLRESFIPRTDPNRTRKAERKNGIPVYKDGGRRKRRGSRCTGSRYGIEWRLQRLARMEEFLLPSLLGDGDGTYNCARSDSKFDFYLSSPETQALIDWSDSQHLCIVRIRDSLLVLRVL